MCSRGRAPISLSCIGYDGRACESVITLRRDRTRGGRLSANPVSSAQVVVRARG